MVDRAVRKMATKGQAGMRWDKVVKTFVWKGIGRSKDDVLSIGESEG